MVVYFWTIDENNRLSFFREQLDINDIYMALVVNNTKDDDIAIADIIHSVYYRSVLSVDRLTF